MLAHRANSVCLLALPHSDRRVLASLLVRVDCAVLCFWIKESKTNQESSPTNNILVGNDRLRADKWENILRVSSEVGEI